MKFKLLAVETRPSRADEAKYLIEMAQSDPEGYRFLALGVGDKLQRLKAHCGSRQGHVIVAELNGRLVGALHKTDRKNGYYLIEEAFVDSMLRGQGVGVLLFLHLLTETNCRGLETKSFSENESVARLNLKMGMKCVSKTPKGKMRHWRSEIAPIDKHKIIDCHVNVTPEELLPPAFRKNTREGMALTFENINTVEGLLNVMHSTGVRGSVILPFPSSLVDPDKVTTYVWEAYERYPDRLRFVPLISSNVEHWLKKGACGFKEHSYYMECNRDSHLEQYKKIANVGVPLLLHPHMDGKAGRVRYILRKVPDLKILLCHSGRDVPFSGKGVLDVARELCDFSEVYFDTSTVWDANVIRELVGIVGPERVLFGSDHPFGLLKGHKDRVVARELAFVRACGLPPEQVSLILHDNAARLFGFDGVGPFRELTPPAAGPKHESV